MSEDFTISMIADRPWTGQWHCGPNAVWITVTDPKSMMSVRAYGKSSYKAKKAATECLELLIAISDERECAYPKAIKEPPHDQ